MKKLFYKFVLELTAGVLTKLSYTKKRSLILDRLLIEVEN